MTIDVFTSKQQRSHVPFVLPPGIAQQNQSYCQVTRVIHVKKRSDLIA